MYSLRILLTFATIAVSTASVPAQEGKRNDRNLPVLPEAYTEIVGTGVSMRLPHGSERHANTNVYVVRELGAAIIVTRISDSVENQIRKLKAPKAKKNFLISEEQKVQIGEAKGTLVQGLRMHERGVWQYVLVLLIENGDMAIMITGVTQADTDVAKVEQLEECMITAKWNPNRMSDPLNQLEYTLDQTEDLRLDNAMPAMQSLVYRESGEPKPKKAGEASFVVMYTKLPVVPPNRREWFTLLLHSDALSAKHSDLRIEVINNLMVDGLNGFEGICTAHDDRTNQRELFYVAAIFRSPTEFYRMWGQVRLKARKRFQPQFKKMTRSFKRKVIEAKPKADNDQYPHTGPMTH